MGEGCHCCCGSGKTEKMSAGADKSPSAKRLTKKPVKKAAKSKKK